MTRATTRRFIVENRKAFKEISDFFTPIALDLIKDKANRKYIEDVVLPMCRSTGKEQRVRLETVMSAGYENDRIQRIIAEVVSSSKEQIEIIDRQLAERDI